MTTDSFDLVVIGAGPGGYVAAIRAAQLGLKVACVEEESRLGGTCLRVGCIPSKALLESSQRYHEVKDALTPHGVKVQGVELDLPMMQKRKDEVVKSLTSGVASLFKKHEIARYDGHGSVASAGVVAVKSGDNAQELRARWILIATGSKPAQLKGVECDGDIVGSSTEALAYSKTPEHLVVIGGGYIGLELGSVWKRLGAKVTVIEYLDRILPGMDAELSRDALKTFKKQGLEFRLGTAVTGVRTDAGQAVVECRDSEPVTADRVLVAVGRVPNTDGLGLAEVGVQISERGFVVVDEHYQTSVPGIYAVGDVIGGAMLAHKAEDEGIACVENLVTGYGHVNYDAVPGIVYTHPEIATVGQSEEALEAAGVKYRKGIFYFKANGRARALGETDGWVKILADEQTDRVLGVHIIGPRAGDLIAEAAVAIEFGASSEDIARSTHAHPTLAEVVREAAFAVQGRAIHA
ncbi:MAG: dihydrolipoyl dehydrogenase [Armatimonadetes bacterium]|nr:dihydrolipoyl dehydrogenase [Armatimonadota bacterium]